MKTMRFERRGKVVEIRSDGKQFVATPERERFESKIHHEDDCWIWTDAPGTDGYGKFQCADGRTERAHRTSWRLFRGVIPKGLLCLHRCDRPLCVNPDHLFLGTRRDNIQDMISKGRKPKPRATINAETAAVIKGRLLLGDGPTAIARDLGISNGVVHGIKYLNNWSDVAPSVPDDKVEKI